MGIAKITRNYQITLPKDIREMQGLKEGDKVLFTLEDGKVHIMKVNKESIRAAAGLWKNVRESGMIYERRIRSQWRKRLKRELA